MKIMTMILPLLILGCKHSVRPNATQESSFDSMTEVISCSKDAALLVETRYIPNYDSLSLFDYYPTKQTLKVRRSNKLTSVDFKFRTRKIEDAGTSIDVLDTAITKAKCINSVEGSIYSIYGVSVAGPSHEFFGIVSGEGDWLWYYYGDRYEVYNEYGDIDSLSAIYGEDVLNSLDGMLSTFP